MTQTLVRNSLWLAFFASILAAWAWLYAMAGAMDVDLIGRPGEIGARMAAMSPGAETAMEMPAESSAMPTDGAMPVDGDGTMDMAMPMDMPMARFGPVFGMWAVMMAAMMLPTLVPTLRAYEDLMVSANGSRVGWMGVIGGYALVWLGFAATIAGVQMALLYGGVVNMLGIPNSHLFAAAVLIVVGLFQFTRAKEICHGVCHSPMSYFLGHWKTGLSGGFRMGLGLGAFCAGCCWGFMALGFVGGVMSLLWMGLATLFMVIEKLPQIGHYVTKPMGVLLILGGAGVLAWPAIAG